MGWMRSGHPPMGGILWRWGSCLDPWRPLRERKWENGKLDGKCVLFASSFRVALFHVAEFHIRRLLSE